MRPRWLVALNGALGVAAIAVLIVVLITVLSQGHRFSDVERRIREVREERVTLHLPPGAQVKITTIVRKGVMPGKPEAKVHVHVNPPGG